MLWNDEVHYEEKVSSGWIFYDIFENEYLVFQG